MSGEQESKVSVTKKMVDELDAILDEYEGGIGLPDYKNEAFAKEELEQYLSMDRDSMEKLTPEDCAEICARLTQFAFHIQRAQNRETARIEWAKAGIKRTIADHVGSLKGYSYEERAALAIKQNDHASKLLSIQNYCEQRASRLNYLSRQISGLSDSIDRMRQAKSRVMRNEQYS